jgi:GH24 family phage-related lysozyme (muramidase)|tara:strand:+ start:271 stop:1509 length:1239 start_codon:yes stop_codon:yes gene_type:complete
MKISAAGIELLKQFEGCRLTAYQDSVGVWTIGFGTTTGVKEGQTISQVKAEEYLRFDLAIFEKAVTESLKVPVNQNQFDALVSFTYNVGVSAFRSSTLLNLINEKTDKKVVAAEFSKWVKAGNQTLPGLVSRRKAESELFLKGAKNDVLAHTILAQRDTWLKRKPGQTSDLTPEQKLFVPKGSAHAWTNISIVPGEVDYKITLEAQPNQVWWFYPTHWKIINDPKVTSAEPQFKHPKKLVLDVPYYSQRDNKKDPLRSCFSSACAMLLKYVKPNSITSDDEYMVTVYKYGDTTEPSAQVTALEQHGLNVEFRQDGGWSDIDSQLAKGFPIPIGVLHHGPVSKPSGGGHWLTIIGRNEDNTAYVVNDPYGEMDLVNGGYQNSNGSHLLYSKKNLGPRWLVEGPGTGWYIEAIK